MSAVFELFVELVLEGLVRGIYSALGGWTWVLLGIIAVVVFYWLSR